MSPIRATNRYVGRCKSGNVDNKNSLSIFLNSRTLKILELLNDQELSAPEIYLLLAEKRPLYRQSVHKTLDKLFTIGVVDKYYDNNDRKIKYKLIKTKFIIDFKDGSMIFE